jgi:hypothetical protein
MASATFISQLSLLRIGRKMPTNKKEYEKLYQEAQRKPQTLQLYVKKFDCFIRETLPNYVKNLPQPLPNYVKKPLQECVKTLQECVKDLPQPLQECVKTLQECVKDSEPAQTPAKPETIGSVGFCGQNSVTPRAMGGRGELSLNTVTDVHTNDTEKTNILKTKLNQTKVKEEFLKNEKTKNAAEKPLSKKDYKIKTEHDFREYWACYPEAGQTNFDDCLKQYYLIKGIMPDVARFMGIIHWKQEHTWNQIKNGFVPMMDKFLKAKEWKGLSHEAMQWIDSHLEELARMAASKITKYNRRKPQ